MKFVLSIMFFFSGNTDLPATLHILTPNKEACQLLAQDLAPKLQPKDMKCTPLIEA